MEELKTIRLLGAAGRKFGRVFRLAVKSPAEAVRALTVLRPDFRAWVLEQHERGVAWRVVTDNAFGVAEDELTRETSSDIVLAPVIVGAGGKGVGIGQIILGIALILVGTLVSFGTVGGGTPFVLMGAGLLFGGVASLLTPTPTLSGPEAQNPVSGTEVARDDDLQSNLFSRNQGTGGQGECVPVLYGQRRVRSPRIISFDLRNLPETRSVVTTGTSGLLGYVNGVALS